jgi:muramoyltetrapeptide carboxypeptidase LdcA involved in peptidoglycan recycling
MVAEYDHSESINARFTEMGLTLTFGSHVDERDPHNSSAVASRVEDLHAAFEDPDVAGILTVIGGYNSNELLPHLDWDLIAANPKVFCGYSDITALQNAILARTGLVTYSGPHWSTFGMRDHFEQTLQWFVEALLEEHPLQLTPSPTWTDDPWFMDQDTRHVRPNDGWWALQAGQASGRIIGGNLCTLNLLQGTPYMPSLHDALLMVEDDFESTPAHFARDLTSLLQLPDASGVLGVVIGRFQEKSAMSRATLEEIVAGQSALSGLPIMGNADFGHTHPLFTFPIGGRATLTVGHTASLTIDRH